MSLERTEPANSPERLRRKLVKTIVISGPSYSGKDTLAAALSERYGARIEDGKEQFERRTGVETGHMKKNPQLHRRFDLFQASVFQKLTSEMARIWQTRLGGVILAEERDRRLRERRRRLVEIAWDMQQGKTPKSPLNDIPAVSVLVIADIETRITRASQAAIEDAKTTGKPVPTRDEIAARMNNRASGDIQDWAPLHPRYIKPGRDPFDRKLKRKNGAPVYDVVIDTSNMTVEEEVLFLEQELEKFGAFESVIREPQDVSGVGLPSPDITSEIQSTLSSG